jgi:NAD(P)-dependent dehydrogenase (short-subunit alcohol dehydrogenase family)
MAARLERKVCVITGTGGRMGRATALALAREGALVVGCGVSAEPAEPTVAMVREITDEEWDGARWGEVDPWPHLKTSRGGGMKVW